MTVEALGLGKSYGSTRAVDELSFTLRPGVVTGFLGPNGAGKSTTMRLMLGLDRGDGRTLWDGEAARRARARDAHGRRAPRRQVLPPVAHARATTCACSRPRPRVPASRIDEVIRLVGLDTVARKRPSGFSLGMGQRLGLAGAILAEPKVLLLDEPANGLDPQSIQWLRDFLRHYAGAGQRRLRLEPPALRDVSSWPTTSSSSRPGGWWPTSRSTRSSHAAPATTCWCAAPTRSALAAALAAEGLAAVPEGADGLAVSDERHRPRRRRRVPGRGRRARAHPAYRLARGGLPRAHQRRAAVPDAGRRRDRRAALRVGAGHDRPVDADLAGARGDLRRGARLPRLRPAATSTARTATRSGAADRRLVRRLRVPAAALGGARLRVAAQAIGQEYRFGLIRLTLTAFPERGADPRRQARRGRRWSRRRHRAARYLGSWIGVVILHGHPLPPDGRRRRPTRRTSSAAWCSWCCGRCRAFALAGVTRQTAIGIAVPIVSRAHRRADPRGRAARTAPTGS